MPKEPVERLEHWVRSLPECQLFQKPLLSKFFEISDLKDLGYVSFLDQRELRSGVHHLKLNKTDKDHRYLIEGNTASAT